MPTIDWNLKVWDGAYAWEKDGDEWTQQAEFCGVPYERWKESLARTFLIPHLREDSVVVEIGPGHGRWSAMIPQRIPKGTLHLVDISGSCLDYCKKRLSAHPNVRYWQTDGTTIPTDIEGRADFIWSFDTFVHIEEPEIRAYARQFFRALKPHGMGVIHHPGSPTPEQRQNGMRSMIGNRLVYDILAGVGFFVIRQTSEWGEGCNMKLTGDVLTVFARP